MTATARAPHGSHPPRQLREAHAHLFACGREMTLLVLSAVRDARECLELVRARAGEMRARGEPGWLVGAGLRPAWWSDPRWPTRDELDRACPDRPCMLAGFDHHSAAANSPALAAGFGVSWESAPDPPGGMLARDARGRPAGLVLERAYTVVKDAGPPATPAQRREWVRDACRSLASHGFVEVHDLVSQPWLGPVLRELDGAGGLPQRVELFVPLAELDEAARIAPQWRTPRVRLAGAKIFVDGTLNSRTALMLEPYREPIAGHEHGRAMMTPEEVDSAIRATAARGLTLAAHAIGDAAVRMVLDAVERCRGLRPRVRIEHAEVIDERDVPRFTELGVSASVQPCHLLYDIEVLSRQLPHRLDRVLPLRDLITAGLVPGETLLFGSDAPIVRPDPADSVRAAVDRSRRSGMPGGEPADVPIAPEQAIGEHEAWAAFDANTSS